MDIQKKTQFLKKTKKEWTIYSKMGKEDMMIIQMSILMMDIKMMNIKMMMMAMLKNSSISVDGSCLKFKLHETSNNNQFY